MLELAEMAAGAGKNAESFPVSALSVQANEDELYRMCDLGVERAILFAPAKPLDRLLPRLDHHAALVDKVT